LEEGSSMKKSRRLLIAIFVLFTVLLFSPSAFSATVFTADIMGLSNPSGIAGYTVWLSIGDSFTFEEFTPGDAMPSGKAGQTYGWIDSPAAKIVEDEPGKGRVFKYGSSDLDHALSRGANRFDLENGTLFSFTYEGDIIDLSKAQFDPGDGPDMFPSLVDVKSFDAVGVTFQYVVPIPSAIFLLGGGLLGLITVRRRRS
jgi:hypothetical protein